MDKSYSFKDIEDKIYKNWEEKGLFNPDNLDLGDDAERYAISMPPPNVTGVLHLGHALENSIMDIETRFQRMQGKKVLLLPGTDHAAVATQAKVEKKLIEEGIKNPRKELGREKLLKKIKEFAEDSKSTILKQIRTMGTSCDWSRLAYTYDETRCEAVNKVFVKMYNDGLIEKGYRVVNWSVKGQSTCSDDELEHEERQTMLYTFKYSADFPISIATTRPETKLGDTAVAVNPDDERYKEYIGQEFTVNIGAKAPLKIKVIADEEIDLEFGTGAVGVTPAHSMIDFDLKNKHNLELIKVIGEDGRMTEEAGSEYAGLTTLEAREKLVEWLKSKGLMEKEEEIVHNVGKSDRFKDVVEVIPMEQWFVMVNKEIPGKGKSLKDLMRSVVTSGLNNDKTKTIKITPERFEKQYLRWIDNLRDWCISRQVWWGHRIPVWYRSTVDNSQLTINNSLNFRDRLMFDLIKEGKKTIETRALNPEEKDRYFGDIKAGDILDLKYIEDDKTIEEFKVKVKRASAYKNTEEMLMTEEIETIWPGKNQGELIEFQKSISGYKEKIEKNGIIALEIEMIHDQEIYVGENAPEGEGWIQDEDTLDTWFSSGLWTFSTLGWPEETEDFKKYHPTAWMQMGYEILFFWMARMILMSVYVLDDIPFKDVYIHGILRAKDGRKFSKSLGNGIDPIEVAHQYGTDALRLSLILGNTPGNDSRYYEEKVESARNLINKLWNISRYILLNSPSTSTGQAKEQATNNKFDKEKLSLSDKWILSELEVLIETVTNHLEQYNFSMAGEELREFTWNKLADWYLEATKFDESTEKEKVLNFVLENLLKLWHPFIPFVTEKIWEEMGNTNLITSEWPKTSSLPLPRGRTGGGFEIIQSIITAIRNARAENKVEPSRKVKAVIYAGKHAGLIEDNEALIKGMRTGILDIEIKEAGAKHEKAIFVAVGDIEIYLLGAIDEEKEKKRLRESIERLEQLIAMTEKKLADKSFVERAPQPIVDKEKSRLEEFGVEKGKLIEQLENL
jgi:valyl-tRNA synthetase